MSDRLWVSNVRLTAAPEQQVAEGFVGYVSLVVNDVLVLDGITMRRSAEGRPYLSYPQRTDRVGARHPYIRPLGEAARVELERQVLAALGLRVGDAR